MISHTVIHMLLGLIYDYILLPIAIVWLKREYVLNGT